MSTAPGSQGQRSMSAILLRRLVIALMLALVVLTPSLFMLVMTDIFTGHVEGAATWASMAAIAGLVAVAVGGVELGLITAFVLALEAPLSIVAGASPVSGAALMAIMCLVVGRSSRAGLQRATMLAPIFIAWTIIDPPVWGTSGTLDRTDTTYLLWMAAFFFVGAIFPVIVGPHLLRKAKLPAPKPHSRSEAVPYTIIITVLATVSTYYVLDHSALYGGGFIVAAILVLTPLGAAESLRPTLIRIAGTLLGAIAVIPIIANVSSLTLIYLIGIVLGVTALVAKFGSRAWIYYALIVPTSACLNAVSVPQVRQLDEQRLIDNLAGGALVLIAVACSVGYSHFASRRTTPEPDQKVLVGVPVT